VCWVWLCGAMTLVRVDSSWCIVFNLGPLAYYYMELEDGRCQERAWRSVHAVSPLWAFLAFCTHIQHMSIWLRAHRNSKKIINLVGVWFTTIPCGLPPRAIEVIVLVIYGTVLCQSIFISHLPSKPSASTSTTALAIKFIWKQVYSALGNISKSGVTDGVFRSRPRAS
jgi:hypothetical protein